MDNYDINECGKESKVEVHFIHVFLDLVAIQSSVNRLKPWCIQGFKASHSFGTAFSFHLLASG